MKVARCWFGAVRGDGGGARSVVGRCDLRLGGGERIWRLGFVWGTRRSVGLVGTVPARLRVD